MKRSVEINNRRALKRAYRYVRAGYLMLFALIVAGPVAAFWGYPDLYLSLVPVALPIATFFVGYAMGRATEDARRLMEDES